MKKYVSLIVCAILSLTALFLPIGKDARFDGKGSGKNESVTNISELNKVLEGKSGTYTFEFDEGLSQGTKGILTTFPWLLSILEVLIQDVRSNPSSLLSFT